MTEHSATHWQEWASSLTDQDIAMIMPAVRDELHQRALTAGDLDAVVEAAFRTAFDAKGKPMMPWIDTSESAARLVCPGSLMGRSAKTHVCQFVAVDGDWVWTRDDLLLTDRLERVGQHDVRTITVLPVYDGMEVTAVLSNCTNRAHRRKMVTTFKVEGTDLVGVSSQKFDLPSYDSSR